MAGWPGWVGGCGVEGRSAGGEQGGTYYCFQFGFLGFETETTKPGFSLSWHGPWPPGDFSGPRPSEHRGKAFQKFLGAVQGILGSKWGWGRRWKPVVPSGGPSVLVTLAGLPQTSVGALWVGEGRPARRVRRKERPPSVASLQGSRAPPASPAPT